MKNTFISLFIDITILFAFCSSVYCLSLILDYFIASNVNFISISFFICIFIVGILININEKKEEK